MTAVTPLRGTVVAFAVLCALCVGASRAVAQDIPDGYEQGIFELTIRDLARVPITALVGPMGELLFPIEPILRHADVPFRADSAGYGVSLIDPERHALPARIDTIALRVSRGAAHLAAEADEMVAAEGDLYLTVRLISYLLSAEMHADFGALELRIDPATPVPAQLALATERRRQLAMIRAGVARGEPLPSTPLRAHSGAGVLHYSMSTAAPDTWDTSVLTLESGFAVLGGLAVLGWTGSTAGPVTDPAVTFRYERFIPEQRLISFIRAGDVLADGAFARSIRGVTVTNRPIRREGFFQDVLIDPEVPAGYEIEVYQGGQLVAFSDGAGQDPIRVPIVYGRTDLEVRMIAPSGEVVTADLLYGVPQSQLPEKAFEYSAGAGACHFQDCERLFAGADYGARRWLTLGGGYEAEHDSLGFEHLPFARALVAPVGGWLADARVVAGRQFSGSAQYNGGGPVTGMLGLDVRTATVPRATLLPQVDTRWDTRAELGVRGHRALGRLGGIEGDGIDRWGVSYIGAIPRGLAIVQLEDFANRPTELSLRGFRLLRRRVFGATTTASGRVTASERGLHAFEIGATGSWGNTFFSSATIGWDRDADLNLTLSFSRILPVGQVAGVASGATGAGAASPRIALRADGAVAFDATDAFQPAAYTGIGFAGIDARVFRDANGNGVMDEGELPAVGVVVQAGDRSASSDSSGHARLWGIRPWEKTAVRASSDWFEPQWAPATPLTVIRPVAHVFNPVDVPLVATREFIAYVVPTEGVPNTSGIGYRLLNERTGKTWEGLTMSDGSIYVSGIPVGDYLLELDPEALDFLRARAVGVPLRFTITMEGSDQFVFELPPIELRLRAPTD